MLKTEAAKINKINIKGFKTHLPDAQQAPGLR